jgi:hypothetical protein
MDVSRTERSHTVGEPRSPDRSHGRVLFWDRKPATVPLDRDLLIYISPLLFRDTVCRLVVYRCFDGDRVRSTTQLDLVSAVAETTSSVATERAHGLPTLHDHLRVTADHVPILGQFWSRAMASDGSCKVGCASMFLSVMGCTALQSLLDWLRISNWTNIMVVLVATDPTIASSIFDNRSISLHASSSIHEFPGTRLVYTDDDI